MLTDRERIAELQKALEMALTGGNHLASNLINLLGAGDGFPDNIISFDEGRKRLYHKRQYVVDWSNEYEQWCCWKSLMDARAIAEKALAEYDGDVFGCFQP